jgi:hypothetical protein
MEQKQARNWADRDAGDRGVALKIANVLRVVLDALELYANSQGGAGNADQNESRSGHCRAIVERPSQPVVVSDDHRRRAERALRRARVLR